MNYANNGFAVPYPVVWHGQFRSLCSFAKVAREMLLAFASLGIEVQGEESKGRTDLNSFLTHSKAAKLNQLIRQKRPERYVLIQHDLPNQIRPDPHAILNIACTAL